MTSPFAIRGVIEGFYGNPWTHAQRLDCRPVHRRAGHEHVRLRPQGRRRWCVAAGARPYDDEGLAPPRASWSRPARRPASRSSTRSAPASRSATPRPPTTPRCSPSSSRSRRSGIRASRCCSTTSRPSSPTTWTGPRSPTSRRRTPRWRRSSPPASGRARPRRLRRSSTTVAATSRTSPASRRRWTRGRPLLDGPRDLLAGPRAGRRPPLRADGRPAAAVLGQLPGQRRRHGLGAPHRPVPRPRRGRSTRRPAGSSPTRWSWPRPRRSRSPRSRTTSPTRPATTPRPASPARSARSPATAAPTAVATRRRSRCSPRTCAAAASATTTHRPWPTPSRRSGRPRTTPPRPATPTALLAEAARPCAASPSTSSAAADHLLRGPVANAALVDECRPWIEAFEVGARAMCRVADLAAEGRLPGDRPAVTAALLPFLAELRRRRVRVFGDALDMFLADTTDHPHQARDDCSRWKEETPVNRKIAKLALVGAGAAMLFAACGGGAPQAGERPRAADRDGLARRGADPRLGRRRGAVHGGEPRDQGRDQLPAGRPVRDHRSARPCSRAATRRTSTSSGPASASTSAQADGYVADITEQFATGPLKGLFTRRDAQGLHQRRQGRHGPVLGRRHERPLVQQGAVRRRRRRAADDLGRAAHRLQGAAGHGRHPDRDRQQGPVAGRQLVRPPRLARRGRARLRARPCRAPASSPRPSGRRPSATSSSSPTPSA